MRDKCFGTEERDITEIHILVYISFNFLVCVYSWRFEYWKRGVLLLKNLALENGQN